MTAAKLAPRLDSLEGARLGFLFNKKMNNEALMKAVARAIREFEPTTKTRTWRKPSVYGALAKRTMNEILENCDALVAGPGD